MKQKSKIYYISLPDEMRKEEKLAWLRETKFKDIAFERITPDAKHNWINLSDNDFDSLLPLIDKDVKVGKSEESIFKMFSSGLKTQRDEWVYDFDKDNLERKIRYFVDVYEATRKDNDYADKMKIKWDRELDKYKDRNIIKEFSQIRIQKSLYRPYVSQNLYFDKNFIGMTYQWNDIYKASNQNSYIAFNALGNNKDFHCISTSSVCDLHLTGDSQCLPQFTFEANNESLENITDWALQKFQANYQDSNITKQSIFHYVYAVLHNPQYRQKYELNLKREFPRIPFYDDFRQWSAWGAKLMDLHINYESQEPYQLKRIDIDSAQNKKAETRPLGSVSLFDNGITIIEESTIADTRVSASDNFVSAPKTKLKADKINNTIEIDSVTTLEGIPPIAWEYKLGNRSALEWILDQYKERKPQDATIAEKFNTYKFADYKESVIELLKKVCTVSVETQKIIGEMLKK